MEEKHTCYLCGSEANHQLKSGKWCCSVNARSCIVVREKVSRATKEKWESLKNKGIRKRKDVPKEQQRNTDKGKGGVCFYCGQEGNHLLKNGRWCCSKNYQSCPEIRSKNSSSCKKNYAVKKSGFAGWNEKRKRGEVSSWNKGLTKETSEIILEQSLKAKEEYKNGTRKVPFLGRHHSIESKTKIAANGGGGIRKGAGRGKSGWYRGYWCDSSWELAYVIYNLEHCVSFERNKLGFEYEFEGKKHRYYPDFKMEDGSYVEIKGYLDKKSKTKISSFQGCLKIIDDKGIEPYLNYVTQKYGKDFTSLYSKKKVEMA